MKTYDRAYFERWYRHPRHRVASADSLRRKVHLAVSVTEFILGRPIRSVLDVGCGEGSWFPVLRRMRPGVDYTGVDSSDYAVRRFGARRNIRCGTFGGLAEVKLPRHVDLVVCADVLQYLSVPDIERGLGVLRGVMRGVAYIETFAAEDAMEGDRDGWHDRPAREYRRLFRRAELVQCGPYCWADPDKLDQVNVFELMS